MKKKQGRGRPPKSRADKQSARISVYFTPAEAKQVKAESVKAGMSPSAYLAEAWRTRFPVREE